MSRAKNLLKTYLEECQTLDANVPRWTRKTTFEVLLDGVVCRRITRADGTLEREDMLAGEDWEAHPPPIYPCHLPFQ
ncbi:MAG: hypothetical protein WCP34_05985 [Pseudomonadota bacterium]